MTHHSLQHFLMNISRVAICMFLFLGIVLANSIHGENVDTISVTYSETNIQTNAETNTQTNVQRMHELYYLEHRLIGNHVKNFEPLFPFETKGILNPSKNRVFSYDFFPTFPTVPEQNNNHQSDDSGRWNEKFVMHPEIDEHTLYQIRICKKMLQDVIQNENVIQDGNSIQDENAITECKIMKTIPYCQIVQKLWKEQWYLHVITANAESNVKSNSNAKGKQIYEIISLDPPIEGEGINSVQSKNDTSTQGGKEKKETQTCQMILQSRRDKKVLPKYNVRLQVVSGIANSKVSLSPTKTSTSSTEGTGRKEEGKEPPKPWYRRYWYFILGILIVFVFTALTAPEEEEGKEKQA